MIMYRITLTTQAEIDLLGIDDYISNELLAPASARKIISAIERKIKSLQTFPERCSRYEHEPWLSRGIRITRAKHYSILFRIDKNAKTVTVLHISYARRNLDQVLSDTR